MEKVPGHGYVRQTARPAGPSIEYFPILPLPDPSFLIGKYIIKRQYHINRFSHEEWALKAPGAYSLFGKAIRG